MASKETATRKYLRQNRSQHGLIERVECTDEENEQYAKMETLPDNVKRILEDGKATGKYVKYGSSDLTQEEVAETLMYKQLETLGTIKNYLLFFVVLTIISMVAGLISIISLVT